MVKRYPSKLKLRVQFSLAADNHNQSLYVAIVISKLYMAETNLIIVKNGMLAELVDCGVLLRH